MAKPRNSHSESGKYPACDWYVVPHIGYWIGVIVSFSYMSVAYFTPQYVPTKSLGPLGQLTDYLIYEQPLLFPVIISATAAIHTGEAVYVFYLARQLNLSVTATLKWSLQTLIVGFASTLIIKSKRDSIKRK